MTHSSRYDCLLTVTSTNIYFMENLRWLKNNGTGMLSVQTWVPNFLSCDPFSNVYTFHATLCNRYSYLLFT